jgi:lipid-A-disaccharide synthase
MVIAYRMGALSWQIMRRKKLQPWVGLPNILCQNFVVPELLQDEASPEKLAAAVLNWLDAQVNAPEKLTALQNQFAELHLQLQRDTPKICAHAIQQILQG